MNNIFFDLNIDADANTVFNAVSDPKHLINWWPLKCSGVAQKDEIYNLFFTEQYDWKARVLQSIPSKSFYLKMTKSDEDWAPTTFGFDIVTLDKGIRLEFWHKGWPQCNHHFKRSSYCWAILIKGLKDYVENGTIVPFEERE